MIVSKSVCVGFCGLFSALLLSCFSGCHVYFSSMDGYSFNYQGQKAERSESDAISSSIKKVEIENKFGSITVKSTAGAPKWEWTIQCWSDDAAMAETLTKEVKMETSTDGDTMVFTLTMPEARSEFNGSQSLLTLHLPVDVEVDCANSFGPIDISGIANASRVSNRHGDVKLADLTENANVDCRHGDVRVEGVGGNLSVDGRHSKVRVTKIRGNVDIETSHDSIAVDRVLGSTTIDCSHGNVKVTKIDGDLRCSISHGDLSGNCSGANIVLRGRHAEIELTALNPKLENIEVKTTHDNVSLVLNSDLMANVKYDVSHGDLDTDFKVGESNGPAKLRVKTSHGDITIRKQNAN